MLENIRGHSRGSIPPLRMPSPLPHDLCHEWNVSRRLPAMPPSKMASDKADSSQQTVPHLGLWGIPLSFLIIGNLHSGGYIFHFLLCVSLLFCSQLFVRLLRQTFCLFAFLLGDGFEQCYRPPSIVFQALCLSDLIPCIYLSHPLYNPKGFDFDYT